MHKVKRAIIMAAGKGQRLHPVTLKTPKPLIKVNGVRMIDTAIRGLHKQGIFEIYVVAGYLKEQFYPLEQEYPGLKILVNPYYDSCNNISSLYVARDHIGDSMILDGDQIIFHDSVLHAEFERSGYNCVWCEGDTDEWLLTAKDGIIRHCSTTGGSQGWQLFSISRWCSEDGRKLKHHLELEFEKKQNHQIYWDNVAMFCYPEEYQLGVYPMQYGDVVEIDNLSELVDIDPSYRKYIS